MGALKTLGPREAELKAMHVAEAARGGGFGARMLDHLVTTARADGDQIYGSRPAPWPPMPRRARSMPRAGFCPARPFGAYGPDPNSVVMKLGLRAGSEGRAPRAPRASVLIKLADMVCFP